jgi:hypothetical protein
MQPRVCAGCAAQLHGRRGSAGSCAPQPRSPATLICALVPLPGTSYEPQLAAVSLTYSARICQQWILAGLPGVPTSHPPASASHLAPRCPTACPTAKPRSESKPAVAAIASRRCQLQQSCAPRIMCASVLWQGGSNQSLPAGTRLDSPTVPRMARTDGSPVYKHAHRQGRAWMVPSFKFFFLAGS